MENSLKQTFNNQLSAILDYWSRYTPDETYGGFFGSVNNNNSVNEKAPKGSVLNARILWSFSAAFNYSKKAEYLNLAARCFMYIKKHFIDNENGGVYWSLDYLGNPLDTKKQIYALAFTIYGLTEYYKASGDQESIKLAKSLYQDIEKYSFDSLKGGYLEAFSIDWKTIGDLRLSDKDANEKKTMNTHLHILEAYTNLYRFWPDENLNIQIRKLLYVFTEHIINSETNHLLLFFDENWRSKSTIVSYGHDIEASWLLLEAAEVLKDELLIAKFKIIAIAMARASAEGLEPDGSLIYEYNKNHYLKEKHWWVQAEAMVGFFNAYQLSHEKHFYNKFLAVWNFTETHIIDQNKGEWFWGVNEDCTLMREEDKAGFWKCPYHNSRVCLEIINRLDKTTFK